jgi:alpha-mannosidase
VANAATHARTEVVAVAGPPPGRSITQELHDGTFACMVAAPGCGLGALWAQPVEDAVVATEHSFTNRHVALTWDLDGDITSVIDVKAGRELLPPRTRIALELAPDHPVEYDAWDVEEWTRGLGAPIGGVERVTVLDAGPLIATLEVVRRFGSSSVTQRTTVRADSPRIDMTFDMEWHEDEKLLSLMVPLAVHAREAACDIQFGHVMRPTHASNSWDAAKFEVCAHRYVDLSEPSFGVAVLNDGRYGHGVQDGGIRISLLRAAKYPDPTQDHGRHSVTVSLLPHGPGLHEVIRQAAALNLPLRMVEAGTRDRLAAPLVTVTGDGVEVSAVKTADDGSGDVIVRLYEACGDRAATTVRLPWRITDARLCNALEEPHASLETSDGIVAMTLRPFELVTLRLGRSAPA